MKAAGAGIFRAMRRLMATVAAAAAVLSCGGGGSGPQPGRTYFWKVASSKVEFGVCSDQTDFRGSFPAPAINDSSFVVYRVDNDGKKAWLQSCQTLDASSCRDSEPKVEFSIVGNELLFTTVAAQNVEGSTCKLQDSQQWNAVDKGQTLELSQNHTLTLVNDATACAALDDRAKKAAPNGFGIEGCVVQITLTATLR